MNIVFITACSAMMRLDYISENKTGTGLNVLGPKDSYIYSFVIICYL